MAEYTPERAIADLREPGRSLSQAECDRIAACIATLCDELAGVRQRALFDQPPAAPVDDAQPQRQCFLSGQMSAAQAVETFREGGLL